jgi:ferrous iron transport protein B
MKKIKILIIGQPNSGKSSLLNTLIGTRVIISNYPGTTVEITRGKKKVKGFEIEFSDTPGIYSISDRSEEEKVTEKALFEEKADGAVIICDATSLERSFYMLLQVMEAGIPVIIAVNFIEEAERKGIKIDFKKIEELFSIPVIPINPLTRRGIEELLDEITKITKIKSHRFRIEYDDHIEEAIEKISSGITEKNSKRFIALRILEEDKDFYRYLKNPDEINKINYLFENHPDLSKDISITRFGTASFIAESVTSIISLKKERKIKESIDRILLNRKWGPVFTLLFFMVIFGVLLFIGNLIQGYLMDVAESFISYFTRGSQSMPFIILGQGLTGLAIGISVALPYVFLFYLLLGFIEDTGLLPRFIINVERLTNKIGLPGKSFIPLALGLGCTAPAIRATRILSSKKEQYHTAAFFAFVPCSSRIAIIMGIVGFYGGIGLAFLVYITLIIAGLISGFVMKKIFKSEVEPLLLELPEYRKPLIKNVLAKSWIRMKDFVYIVIPLLIAGGIIYGILNAFNLTDVIVRPFSFITTWLGLPDKTIIPLTFGFLQKDLTGAMLLSVIGSNITIAMAPIQIYTFGVAATVGIPCIIALGVFINEFGPKRALLLIISMNLYGIFVAGLIWRIWSFFNNIF